MKPEITRFFTAIRDDSRVGPIHISIFMAIVQCWEMNDYKVPISIFSHELMQLAKISGIATYHRNIRELHNYGYIYYEPSFNHFSRSRIYLK